MKIEGKYTIAQVYTTKDAATAIDDYAVAQMQGCGDAGRSSRCGRDDRVYTDSQPGHYAECGGH